MAVFVNYGSANATATVDNPGDYNTSPKGFKVVSNKITITGVAVGSASFTIQNKSTSGNPWANFKTYNVTVTNPYTVIPTPTAEAGLVYDGESHQGVRTGEHYTLGGTYTAVNAGTYAATVPVTIDAVKGVEPTKIKVVHTTSDGTPYDITRAFAIAGDAASGVIIALDGAASVEIPLAGGGSETVTVEPRLTESGDKAIEPFEVDAGEVDVGVRTIPGLTYELTCSTTVVTVSEGAVVDSKRAEATRTKLSDPFEGGRPNKAFYVIRVTK